MKRIFKFEEFVSESINPLSWFKKKNTPKVRTPIINDWSAPYVIVDDNNYDNCVDVITKALEDKDKVLLQVRDTGYENYRKLMNELGLKISKDMVGTDKPWGYVEVTTT